MNAIHLLSFTMSKIDGDMKPGVALFVNAKTKIKNRRIE
jgi:signal recognition particle GTPase